MITTEKSSKNPKRRKRRKRRSTEETVPSAPLELQILIKLAEKAGELTAQELAHLACVHPPSVYPVLGRLRTNGYVATRREKKRYMNCYNRLTDKGVQFTTAYRTMLRSLGRM